MFVHALVVVVELLLRWGFNEFVCGCIGNEAGSAGITALAAVIEAGHCQQLQKLGIACEQPNATDSRELIGTAVGVLICVVGAVCS